MQHQHQHQHQPQVRTGSRFVDPAQLICPGWFEQVWSEPPGVLARVIRVLAHCAHLGIDADELAAQLHRENTPLTPPGRARATDSARPGGHHNHREIRED